jgi:microcystin-dependent protein
MRKFITKINKVGDGTEAPTTLNAGEANSLMQELDNVLDSAGINPSSINPDTGEDLSTNQLALAVYEIAQKGFAFNDNTPAITPNDVVLSSQYSSVLKSNIPFFGQRITWISQYTNTRGCTLKVDSYNKVGLKSKEGLDLQAFDLAVGGLNEAFFDGANWRLLSLSRPLQTGLIYAGAEQPGSLKCNGAMVSRTTYARLYSKIGNTFGAGDGSTTFKIPDIRNRVLRGAGTLIGVGDMQENKLIEHDFSLSTLTAGGVGGLRYFTDASTTKGPNLVEVKKSSARPQEVVAIVGNPVATPNFSTATFTIGKGNTETTVKALGVDFWIYY